MQKLHTSQYRLRRAVGLLGLALPVLLLLHHDHLLASMSHYYYTTAAVFFIGILVAFGLILITYEGYPLAPDSRELMSDQTATTLAGVCIFLTVLIPTRWADALGPIAFEQNCNYLFGHNHPIRGAIHLLSAGLFLALLGYMCYAKFPCSPRISKTKKRFYQSCGITIWAAIALLVLLFAAEALWGIDWNKTLPAYTFWLEMVAVWAFGIAWLVKGKVEHYWQGRG